jgi:hypothetical protein
MTREEAIEEVEVAFDIWESEYDTGNDWSKEHEARDMAIKALEQEPVLDKLRERVELEKLGYPPSAGYYKAIMKVLQIIDKYRA